MRPILYSLVFSLPILLLIGMHFGGLYVFLPLILAFVLIPSFELVIPASSQNLTEEKKKGASENQLYDYLLFSVPFIAVGVLIVFLSRMQNSDLLWFERLGMILGMGLIMGAMGINAAHELGHRRSKVEQFLAKALLTTAQYTQFFIDHNKGHHRNVGTPEDSATARYNETVYQYWIRVIVGSYRSAWQISNRECKRKKNSVYSLSNEMLRLQLGQLVLVLCVFAFFGWEVLLYYIAAAAFAIVLLETVEYVEHYGLSRKKVNEHRYENVRPVHSWNSNHVLGRLFLFELSRHSDHHFDPHKKYQLLDHWEESPQLPTGYPGCMILSLVPPLWFGLVNSRIPTEVLK